MNSLMSITISVIIAAMKQVGSDTCIGEYCFTTPNSNDWGTFESAKSWCTNKYSALAVIDNDGAQLALTQFLKSSNTSALAFINMKLLYQGATTWFLVNGQRYNGDIGNQDPRESGYKLYCYLKSYGNNFHVDASNPSEMNRYVCEFQDIRCLNYSNNNFLYNERCYVKYENDALTWYQARERCSKNGGDLATFQNDQWNKALPLLNTSWLNPSLTYWVGIRWNDWRWISPDVGNEAIYTSWSSTEPNNYNYQCVCVDPTGNPAWSWTDCSCGDSKQFVCLKIVPTTTTSTTTTTTTRAPITSTTSEVKAGSNSNSTSNALAIGLGAGLGGGLFLIGLVVLVVVVVMLMRKRHRKNNGVESRHIVENTTTTTTTNIELTTPDVYAQVVPTTQHPANNKPPNEVIYAQPDFSNNRNSTSSGSDPSNIRQGRVQSIMLQGSNDLYANATSAS